MFQTYPVFVDSPRPKEDRVPKFWATVNIPPSYKKGDQILINHTGIKQTSTVSKEYTEY